MKSAKVKKRSKLQVLEVKIRSLGQDKKAVVQGPKSIKECYQAGMRLMPVAKASDGYADLGFPADEFKNAMMTAIPFCKTTREMIWAGVFVVGDVEDLVRINYPKMPMRTGVAHRRYRLDLSEWSATVRVRINKKLVSEKQVLGLMRMAGLLTGIGASWPKWKGEWGKWEVIS